MFVLLFSSLLLLVVLLRRNKSGDVGYLGVEALQTERIS